jgi:purine-cytosine permease-like protein
MPQHLLVRQKFGYFGVIAIILIITVALCLGLTHI